MMDHTLQAATCAKLLFILCFFLGPVWTTDDLALNAIPVFPPVRRRHKKRTLFKPNSPHRDIHLFGFSISIILRTKTLHHRLSSPVLSSLLIIFARHVSSSSFRVIQVPGLHFHISCNYLFLFSFYQFSC